MILIQTVQRRRESARALPMAGLLTATVLAVAVLACLIHPGTARAQTPYLGEIRLIAFNYAPKGWAFCDGQILPINQNQAIFSLLGTQYGGNGTTTFALPDLRGRVAISSGQGPGLSSYVVGQAGGQESHALTVAEMPQHTHVVAADPGPGTSATPASGSVVVPPDLLPSRNGAAVPHYGTQPNATLAPSAIGVAGGGQPHENRPPSLTLHYIIALQGIFPSRNAPGMVQSDGVPAPVTGLK